MKRFIKISLGQTLVKKGITQGCSHTFRNETFEPSSWLSPEQITALGAIMLDSDYPTHVLGFEIIRGAFHGSCTRIKPLIESGNWGRDNKEIYISLLERIADAIGWQYTYIDGSHAVLREVPPTSTWERWKKNNPSSHLREASKKNWDVYHNFIGDIDSVGEFKDELYVPEKWNK